MKKCLLYIFCLSFFPAFAGNVFYPEFSVKQNKVDHDDSYFSIQRIKVTDISLEKDNESAEIGKSISEVIITLDKLVAIGSKVWKIIEGGRPVSDVQLGHSVSVLPRLNGEVVPFDQMENWSLPASKTFQVEFVNGFGMSVISFEYSVDFQYGGNFNGSGLYLNAVSVRASNVSVNWGFEFNALSSVVSISNLGSGENPVAAASLELSYKAKSVMSDITSSERFDVSGRGEFVRH